MITHGDRVIARLLAGEGNNSRCLTKLHLLKSLHMTTEVGVCNGLGFPLRRVTVELPDPVSDSLLGVLLCVGVIIQAFSITERGKTCKKLKIPFFLLLPPLLLSFHCGLLVVVYVLTSLPHCSSGALSSCGVFFVYSSMLRCFIGVLYCGGFFMRLCSLPLCLIGCLPLSWGGAVVGVDVELICVGGVCQKDSIVGWSAGSGRLLP